MAKKIKLDNQSQQQSEVCVEKIRENPNPCRAQGLCRENLPAAEVPERTTIALIFCSKIDQWSTFKDEMRTIWHMPHGLFQTQPMVDFKKENCGPYAIDSSVPIGKLANDRCPHKKCRVPIKDKNWG